MKRSVLIGFMSFIFILLVGGVSASSVAVWQGQYYTGTTFNVGTYTFNFTVYDSLTGGNICFTNTTSLTTGNWGQWITEQSPWTTCNNASKEYYLNINIDGSDQTPRRRLVVSDFLRRDIEVEKEGNLNVTDNVTAQYFFGDGSFLVGVNGSGDINSVQGDGIYLYNGSLSGNVVLALNETKLNSTIDLRASGLGDNSSWNESYADTLYAPISEPLWSANFSLYNATWSLDTDTTYSHLSNFTNDLNFITQAYGNLTYHRLSDFSISDYYLASNPFGFWNDTYATFNESYADAKYLNLSGANANQDINIAPYNFESANLTLTQKITFALGEIIDNIVDGWIRINGGLNVTDGVEVGGNVTLEEVHLENDPVNHRIYDNSTCVIIRGDTSTMNIC